MKAKKENLILYIVLAIFFNGIFVRVFSAGVKVLLSSVTVVNPILPVLLTICAQFLGYFVGIYIVYGMFLSYKKRSILKGESNRLYFWLAIFQTVMLLLTIIALSNSASHTGAYIVVILIAYISSLITLWFAMRLNFKLCHKRYTKLFCKK